MSAKKIIENLYLGNQYSIPDDAEIIINCAAELFPQLLGEIIEFQQKGKTWYFNFQDMPRVEEINPQLVEKALKTIEEHVKKGEKVYVHCLWGINRSASTVFMYLVRNNLLKSTNLKDAMKEFKRIYPNFGPNPGWKEFLQQNYPFKEF